MHTAARTTSMLASAALLGALAIAGLTMNFTFTPPQFPDGARPITMAPDDPPVPPPPIPHPHTPPPLQTDQQQATTTDPVLTDQQPLQPVSTEPFSGPVVATILNPHWLHRPSNLQAYYPRRALQRNVEGVVQLDCRVTTTGNLQCLVISETPAGWDFGRAALRIAADHQMTPATRDGVPVEGRYQMRVPFRLN